MIFCGAKRADPEKNGKNKASESIRKNIKNGYVNGMNSKLVLPEGFDLITNPVPATILIYVYRNGGSVRCCERIYRKTGINSLTSVYKVMKKLEESDLIKVERNKGKGNNIKLTPCGLRAAELLNSLYEISKQFSKNLGGDSSASDV